jgi:lactoylglutathione lyase
MPAFQSLTPNLVVSDIDRSLSFYRDLLGFSVVTTVPELEPFVFIWLRTGDVQIFLNAQPAAAAEYPELARKVVSGSWTMFIVTDAVDDLHTSLSGKARVVMPLETKFYGMREFAIADPDGFVITFAEKVAG